MKNKSNRLKRALKIRKKLLTTNRPRLSIHKSLHHIYAQIISTDGCKTLASVSTVQSDLRLNLQGTSNISAAQLVGKRIAEQALGQGISEVSFDRSGFKYHGRVKALADSAREAGLKF